MSVSHIASPNTLLVEPEKWTPTPVQRQFAIFENTLNIWLPYCDNLFLFVPETLS